MRQQHVVADYPFYRGDPLALSSSQWLVPLSGVGLATWALIGLSPRLTDGAARLLPPVLFLLLPLVGLALVAGRYWTALFRTLRPVDIGWMLVFAVLNTLIAIPLGLLAVAIMDAQPNPGVAALAQSSRADQAIFLAGSIPQLIGEEVVTIIPFLALLSVLTRTLGTSARTAVIVAWLVSALWFAAIHLPTYRWNVAQCLLLIGGARLVLTLAYLKTRNVWVSAGAHILNDWATFTLSIAGSLPKTG